jgi:diguanylate cyclase (GGDEF)-like protein
MDVCGRIGGDEFVIIGRGENFADIFKKRFDAELERKNQEMNKPYELSASVGFINAIPDKSDTLIEFIQQADAEMYLVKKARRKQRI